MKGLHCTFSHKSKAVGERLFLSRPGDFFYLQRTSFAFWISKYTYTKDGMYNQCPDFNGGSAKPALQPNQAWNLWRSNCNCKNIISKTEFSFAIPSDAYYWFPRGRRIQYISSSSLGHGVEVSEGIDIASRFLAIECCDKNSYLRLCDVMIFNDLW